MSFFCIFLTFAPFIEAGATQSDALRLEIERHWETYRTGGTCISGGNNLFVGNIDNDPELEVITGGSTYSLLENGSAGLREAPLRIWNWNGQNLTLELKQNWSGNINCVYASDVDGDGQPELLTGGSIRNESGVYSAISVWQPNGSALYLRGRVEGVSVTALCASDVNQDGKQEIISVGRLEVQGKYGARIDIWDLGESNLIPLVNSDWCITNTTSVSSVSAQDLDKDGKAEIVTAGYAYDLKNSSGHLRIWQYNRGELSVIANEEWRLVEGVYGLTIAGGIQGNTGVNNMKAGDVDGDGISEIVTGGFAFDGQKVNAQLRVWSWNGKTVSLEGSKEWTSDYLTEVKSITLADFDSNGKIEIITSGMTAAEGSFDAASTSPEMAQLRVWSWDGKAFDLVQSKDWTVDEGACAWSVASGDVDSDGRVEVVTVGCTYFSDLCDPDMRIWSLTLADYQPNELLMVGAVVFLIVAIISIVIILRKKHASESLAKII
jgi:hypothetical protein